MTDAHSIRNEAVASIVAGVVKKTSMIVSFAAVIALIYGLLQGAGSAWWMLPASVLFGGALGLLNFRWLAIAVERVYLRQGATPAMSNIAAAVINVLKLGLIFIVLFIVMKWRLLHVFGLVAGLSLCFAAILWEGVTLVNRVTQDKSD